MKIVPIQDMLDILNGSPGTCREAEPGEEPDFVMDHDKLCTGLAGRKRTGETYSFNLEPPVYLVAGRGYMIELTNG